MTTKDLHNIFLQFPKISTDTRTDVTNSMFFALKGGNFNGNKYAATALKNGAKYAIIDEAEYQISEQYILVDDVLKALQLLAAFHRKTFEIPVLAITGTNGKTTTKELISRVLFEKFNLIATKGNLNNHIGVPLTLLSITSETEFAIIEMGANHPFEIKELCEIADPNFGLITNIGKAHIEGFGSIENIIKTKTELYAHISNKNGHVFVNIDNDILRQNLKGAASFGYSVSKMAAINGEVERNSPFLEIRANVISKEILLKTKLIGDYNLENVLAAIACGYNFGIETDKIQSAIESYQPDNLRSQYIETESNKLILDAYNANPTSMKAAISNFDAIEAENKVLILGDMLELGKASKAEHRNTYRFIERRNFNQVFLVGDCFLNLQQKSSFQHFKNTSELIDYLQKTPIANSYILVKGSRGIRLEKVVAYL